MLPATALSIGSGVAPSDCPSMGGALVASACCCWSTASAGQPGAPCTLSRDTGWSFGALGIAVHEWSMTCVAAAGAFAALAVENGCSRAPSGTR